MGDVKPRPMQQWKGAVTNVDDEGNELGSGTMELTQTELILHTRKRDAVRWPYLCLRRYGYDSNLFSFESGRRCQTGQGIFAFKCSRAEEIFNLLQELMQCNSINVVEEPSSRQPSVADEHGHSLMGLDDQAHTYVNTASVEGEIRGRHCVHSLPEVRPSSFAETARGVPPMGGQGGGHPGMHCCPLEEHEDPQVFLQTASQEAKFMLGPTPAQRRFLEMERERRAMHSHGLRGLEDGGAGSELEGPGQAPPLPPMHMRNPHSYHHHHHHVHHRHPGPEHQEGCQLTRLTYENINGLRGGGRRGGGGRLKMCPGSVSHSGSSSSSSGGDSHPHPHPLSLQHPHSHSLPPQTYVCDRSMGAHGGGCHRKTALLNYENLPSLPPVWEYQALQRDEDQDEDEEDEDQEEDEEYEEEDYDEYEFSEGPGTPNGYHHQGGDGLHGDSLRNYVNTERMGLGSRRPACPPRRQQCQGGGVFSFDFRRGGSGRGSGGAMGCDHAHMAPSRQLNYIQVDLDGDPDRQAMGGGGGEPPQAATQHQPPLPSACAPPPRRSEFYAVIDLKKTAAMSNLQKALPRDDGTSRKTRHNSTDLPL
ncbi:hypothetical protein JZ751_023988 [Albula glossodonta]|uniref:IRS-type PTB domain-containing protein n=1 Tax=Albula glossodonta TaxID=121402 RepID=A0A8T2NP00_9TELE|nr:hypothetical protein JZ751_023988 [Albula glossodonta]